MGLSFKSAWREVGGIRGLNGEMVWVAKVKEWQLEVEMIEIEERAANLKKGWDDDKRDATPAEKAAEIQSLAQDAASIGGSAALLAERALFDQPGEHRRRGVAGVERIGLRAEVVLHRLDDVGHGVQAHHVGGAEGAAAGAAELLAGQVVHHVVSQEIGRAHV